MPAASEAARPRRFPAVAFALAVVAAGAAVASTTWISAGRAEALPVYWELPDFSLLDQHGRARTRADLLGAPWIADFIFTRCAGVCPQMTARMARLQGTLPGTRLVSITVDPSHDTPEVLARYARDFEAGPDWLFLTGPREALYRLSVDGFKLEAMETPADRRADEGPFLHSSKLVLMDARGRVRGYYDSGEAEAMARLAADVATLAETH